MPSAAALVPCPTLFADSKYSRLFSGSATIVLSPGFQLAGHTWTYHIAQHGTAHAYQAKFDDTAALRLLTHPMLTAAGSLAGTGPSVGALPQRQPLLPCWHSQQRAASTIAACSGLPAHLQALGSTLEP